MFFGKSIYLLGLETAKLMVLLSSIKNIKETEKKQILKDNIEKEPEKYNLDFGKAP